MLVEFAAILAKRIQDAVHTLDTRQALQLQGQVEEQETILQKRIKVHEHSQGPQSGGDSHGMGTDASGTGGTLRNQGRSVHGESMQKLEESFEQQQSARILEAASKWEDHILTKSEEVMLGIKTGIQELAQTCTQEYVDCLEQEHLSSDNSKQKRGWKWQQHKP